jgi:SpoIIAA-like
MIETLKDFPADAVAVRCSGFVTKTDYDQVLTPAIEQALKVHERLRLYYEISPDFSGISPGAMWEDFWVGIQHLTRWTRVAVVTDVLWIKAMVHIFGFLLPAATRVFPLAEAAEARAWLGEASSIRRSC